MNECMEKRQKETLTHGDNETKRHNTENEPITQRMNEKMKHRNAETMRQ